MKTAMKKVRAIFFFTCKDLLLIQLIDLNTKRKNAPKADNVISQVINEKLTTSPEVTSLRTTELIWNRYWEKTTVSINSRQIENEKMLA